MGDGPLTDRTIGTIENTFWNEIHAVLNGDFVGRNTSGVATALQRLGTPLIPWGEIHGDSLFLGGRGIEVSEFVVPAFRIISGRIRTTSNQPLFLQAAGPAGGAQFTVLAAATDLVFAVDNETFTLTADIIKSALSLAPAANNTAQINDTVAVGQFASRAFGEFEAPRSILIDTIGTEISGRDQSFQSFELNGDIFIGFIDIPNSRIISVLRGYYFDDSDAPQSRQPYSNNDVLTLLQTHWIFLDKNLATVDTTINQPVYSATQPSGPATGDYWFDLVNELWKRFDGAVFQIVDRAFLGYAICDATDCLYTRATDFDARYKDDLNLFTLVESATVVRSQHRNNFVNVAGRDFDFRGGILKWDISTSQLVGTPDSYFGTEQANLRYWIYITDEGDWKIADMTPYFRQDLRGYYHPYNPWRAVASVENDGSSDFDSSTFESFSELRQMVFDSNGAFFTDRIIQALQMVVGTRAINNFIEAVNEFSGDRLSTPSGFFPSGVANPMLAGFSARSLQQNTASTGAQKILLSSPPPATHGLVIIRGTVSAVGAVTRGEGFSVTKPSTGVYSLTFTQAFHTIPVVVATLSAAGVGHIGSDPIAIGLGSNDIRTFNAAGTPTDVEFNFMAIGEAGA